ncbi:hypothetical protein DFP73DRAFT_539954 [Morchella snyderi]|nr:hypothetical protein DFP73DRAFT_539954 [Morchella snyderi]
MFNIPLFYITLGVYICFLAQVAASNAHRAPENHIPKGQEPSTPPSRLYRRINTATNYRSALSVQAARSPGPPAPTSDKYNVHPDDSWWCGLSAVGSPPEFYPDSIYPVNYLFTAAAVSKTMAMVVGLGRGNFRKYPGKFMNRDGAGRPLLPDIVLPPGFTLKYFPILHDGTKWAPKTKDASQDAGNFRMVYSASADKKTVNFHGLVFHPPRSQELRVCIKLAPEQAKPAKRKMQAPAPGVKKTAAVKL